MQALEALTAQAAPSEEKARPYSTRAWGEIARLILPPPIWFLGECLALGYGRVRLHTFFGQGGLGKSRIGMNIARNQVLGLPFGGMATGDRPLRHLFMGTENGLHRLQHDIRKMSGGLSPEQVALLDAHIFLATLESVDDPYVTLSDPANVERWRATITERRPDVLWADPWGDVQAGDANAETDARWTIAELTKVLGAENQNASVVVLAHARTGAKNIMEAIGYDGANFGKGSKALYSCSRAVFNLAPGGEDENPPVIVACPKNNDGPKPPPFALRLDETTMTYSPVPDFDVETWLEDIRERANGKKKAKPRRQMSEEDAAEFLTVETDTVTGARQRLRDAGVNRDEADDLVKKLVASGRWEQWRPTAKNPPTYVGPPAAMKARRELWVEQHQRALPV
ncbi:MAG: AAA family ATPase [Lentisphaerae bacterium]|nr:AAA family ATPase [Lentisphaerota bacterium]